MLACAMAGCLFAYPVQAQDKTSTAAEELVSLTKLLELIDQGDTAQAAPVYEDHLKRFPQGRSREAVKFLWARTLHQRKLNPEALSAYTAFIDEYPHSARMPLALFRRAHMVLSTDPRAALADLEVALPRLDEAENVETAHAMWHVGDLRSQHGDKNQAIALLKTLTQRFPDSPWAKRATSALRKLAPDANAVQPSASSRTPAGPIAVGKPALDFEARTLTGKRLKLSELKGKIVLLDFWATWCAPCLRELPNVKQVYRKYKDRNFTIVGVSLDRTRDRLEQFLVRERIPWPQVFDGKAWDTAVAQLYQVRAIPRMYLLDAEGVVRYVNLRGEALGKAVAELVAEQTPAP